MIKKWITNKTFVAFSSLFCCALWGISTPVVKMGYRHIDASHIPSLLLWVGLEFVASGLITIGIYSLYAKKRFAPKKIA